MKYRGFILLPTVLLLALVAAITYTLLGQSGSGLGLANSALKREKAAMLAEAGLARALWSANNSNCINYAATGTKTLGEGSYSATFLASSSSPVTITASGVLADGSSQQRQITSSVYSTTNPYDDPYGTGVVWDSDFLEMTSIDQSSSATGSLSIVGGGKRGLFRIDNGMLDSKIHDGAYIVSATLTFQVSGASGDLNEVPIFQMTSFWHKDYATWDIAKKISVWDQASATWKDEFKPWGSKGGDFTVTPVAKASVAGTQATWDITSLVRGWKSRRMLNAGAIFVLPKGTGSVTLSQPKLTVKYRCDCGDARCRFGINTDKRLAYWVLSPDADFELAVGSKKGSLSGKTITMTTQSNTHAGFRFDFSNWVATLGNGKIVDVRLNLYSESGTNIPPGGVTARVYRITAAWSPTGTSWDNQIYNTIYYDQSIEMGSAAIKSPSGLQSFYIAPYIVKGWLSGTYANHGMTIFFSNRSPIPSLTFSSMESDLSSHRPQLVIAYLPP